MAEGCRLAAVAGLSLMALGLLGAVTAWPRYPPQTVSWDAGAGARGKPPVAFSHRRHEERRLACAQCHHVYQGRRNVWRQGQPVKRLSRMPRLLPQGGDRADLKNACICNARAAT